MFESKLLLNDRQQGVDTNGNPNLSFYRVTTSSEKMFDSEVLFDPLEEQLHVPPALVELSNYNSWQCKVIC